MDAYLAENATEHARLVVNELAKLRRSISDANTDRRRWEEAEVVLKIPYHRLDSGRPFDLRSQAVSVWQENVYLRVKSDGTPSSFVTVQLCAQAPQPYDSSAFDHLHICTDWNPAGGQRRIGGIPIYETASFERQEPTAMVALDDGSEDKCFGGLLKVVRYSFREAYDGDGEVTEDGPGSAAEMAGIAAGYESEWETAEPTALTVSELCSMSRTSEAGEVSVSLTASFRIEKVQSIQVGLR